MQMVNRGLRHFRWKEGDSEGTQRGLGVESRGGNSGRRTTAITGKSCSDLSSLRPMPSWACHAETEWGHPLSSVCRQQEGQHHLSWLGSCPLHRSHKRWDCYVSESGLRRTPLSSSCRASVPHQGPENSVGKGRGRAGSRQEAADAPNRLWGQQGSGPGSRHFCFPSDTPLLKHIKSSPRPRGPRKNRTHIVLPDWRHCCSATAVSGSTQTRTHTGCLRCVKGWATSLWNLFTWKLATTAHT